MASVVRGVRLEVNSLESRAVPGHWGGWWSGRDWGRDWSRPADCSPQPNPNPPPAGHSLVSGIVYADLNKDGMPQDWETRLQGVTVTLSGRDTAGNRVRMTTTTDQGGLYLFDKLQAGTYSVRVTTPAGYTAGAATIGSFGGNPSPNFTSDIQVPDYKGTGGYNFGELVPAPNPHCGCSCTHNPPPAATSTVGGFVYLDLDKSTTFNAGDQILPNVAISITRTDGTTFSSNTTTGTDGTYSFSNLAAGTYTITATVPDGLATGYSYAGVFGGTPGANQVTGINIPAGQTSNGYDFSFQQMRLT